MVSDIKRDARAYARIRYRLLLMNLGVWYGFLLVMQGTGFSQALARWWALRIDQAWLVICGYLVVFGVLHYVVKLPLHGYASYRLEHRFGLSRMTLRQWWVREAKRVALSGAIGVLLVEGLYAILRRAPSTWPIWATLGWVGFSVVMARVFPTLVLPIFYKTTPLQDEVLTKRLLELCRRAGLSVLGVFRFDLGAETRKANAALAGLGKTRRVLLADTLLAEFTPPEIEGVLAHEVAHSRYRHITKLLAISAVGSWIAFRLADLVGQRWVVGLGLQGLEDIGGFPVLALWLSTLGLIGMPVQNAISRHFEWQADRFATEMTQPPQAFADALKRLATLNLADPDPPAWIEWMFYDHPAIGKRIRAAEGSP